MLKNVVFSWDYLYSNASRIAESYKIGCHCPISFYIILSNYVVGLFIIILYELKGNHWYSFI